jgi:hypothetical protein
VTKNMPFPPYCKGEYLILIFYNKVYENASSASSASSATPKKQKIHHPPQLREKEVKKIYKYI